MAILTLPTWYDAGTVSVTNGSTTVTGTSTLWGGDAIMPGDLFCDPAQPDIPPQRVASVTANGELELWANWPGTTMTDAAYEIRYVGIIERSTAQTRKVLEQLGVVDANGRGLFFNFIGVTGDADPGIGNVSVDSATFASITHIYIDDIDANTNGQDVTSTVSLWSPGTILILRSPRSAAYMSFRVASVTINSGYRDIVVTPVGQSSTLTTEAISIDWAVVGEGVTIDYVGTFAERDAYDAAAEGTFFAAIDGEDGLGGPTVLYRKESAVSGDWSPAIPFQGSPGDRGWAPVFAVVSDGARRVLRLVDYVGGEGAKPTAGVNQYVSTAGMTATIGDATDIRGGTGATGTPGTNGTNGTDGVDGTDPGILLNWDNGTTDADPGAGNIRADNGDLSVATVLYVSKSNRVGNDIAGYLLGLAGSTNPIKGGLTLTHSGGAAQGTFNVTGVTDATDYVKVAVASHSGATGFTDADAISFQFTRYGDQGSADATSVASAINGSPEIEVPSAETKFAVTDPDNGDVLSWVSFETLSDTIKPPPAIAEAKTANYTVLIDDAGKTLVVSAAAAARTITLPAAATAGNGFRIAVKKSDSSANTVTIDADGSETIDGSTTLVLRGRNDAITLICDGSAWQVVAGGSIGPDRFSVPMRMAIDGLKPDKMSTNVLRLHPGFAISADGLSAVSTSTSYDIDMSTTGAGGLDTGSPTNGVDYFVYVIRRTSDGAFGAVISSSITYGGVTLPSGYTHVRKLRFGFVYNSTDWDGIPAHDAANWPWPFIRLTGAEAATPWRALTNGTATSLTDIDLSPWVPDNCRMVQLMVRVASATAGDAALTSSGAGHGWGLQFASGANGQYVTYVPSIRVSSDLKLKYKVTGGVTLNVFVLGYYATEPS